MEPTPTIPQLFVADPPQANSVTTIDGYTFKNFTYVNAWELWFVLRAQPNYVSRPPVTSIGVSVEVTGNVKG